MPDTLDTLPTELTLRLTRGMKTTLEVTITDADTGNAINITNDTVEMLIMDELGGTKIFEQENGVGEHSTPASGKTRFVVDVGDLSEARSIATERWTYAIHWKGSAGEQTPVAGDCQVVPYATEAIS